MNHKCCASGWNEDLFLNCTCIAGKAFKFNFSLLTLQQKIIELKTKEFLELAEHVQSEMEKLV